eukprot:5123019-Prymnesium_polylepis.1
MGARHTWTWGHAERHLPRFVPRNEPPARAHVQDAAGARPERPSRLRDARAVCGALAEAAMP